MILSQAIVKHSLDSMLSICPKKLHKDNSLYTVE